MLYKIIINDPDYHIKSYYERMLSIAKEQNQMFINGNPTEYLFCIYLSMILLLKQYLLEFDVLINCTYIELDSAEIYEMRNVDFMLIVKSLYRDYILNKVNSKV